MSARDLSLFLGQLLRRPHEIVALAPSSTSLARKMCEGLSPETGKVAELGPGTGKITRAILERGVREEDISGFELNPSFHEILTKAFPNANILNEPAQALNSVEPGSFGAVVSGLPLLSMPTAVQREIVRGAFHALSDGGKFVQFTYGPVPPIAQEIREDLQLDWTVSSRVWGNLPPARVYQFRRNGVLN
ncbi:class I SAM-dependent methyltransferase [Actibacterium pelagium]|uniref:SAM-dependent methyltransferase n=1 Tax=Actibacterium pelagium TaxID=2029103 RepID=A0A917ACU3_9RHOB|nr:methyltransferase domain-containing protein [Actibacterium pelagium]GGE43411.1 SAM-dependent methyltransferase [Actibacterium pelagium]